MLRRGRVSDVPYSHLPVLLLWLVVVLLLPYSSAKGLSFLKKAKSLPQDLVDFELLNATSSCSCRVMCLINSSCTAITAHQDNGNVNCFFSSVEIPISQLVSKYHANTWINKRNETAVYPNGTTNASSSSTENSTSEAAITTPIATTTTPTTITATATTATTSTTTQSGCPAEWTSYEGSCYLFSSNKLSWSAGKDQCVSFNGDYVKITNDTEFDFVNDHIQDDSWIGLNDRDAEGTYKWSVDDSVHNGSQHSDWWGDGQPDNYDNQDCFCCGVKEENGVLLKEGIFDRDCDNEYKYVCEKDPN